MAFYTFLFYSVYGHHDTNRCDAPSVF